MIVRERGTVDGTDLALGRLDLSEVALWKPGNGAMQRLRENIKYH